MIGVYSCMYIVPLSTSLVTHVLFQNTHYSDEEGIESQDKDVGIESHDEEEVEVRTKLMHNYRNHV